MLIWFREIFQRRNIDLHERSVNAQCSKGWLFAQMCVCLFVFSKDVHLIHNTYFLLTPLLFHKEINMTKPPLRTRRLRAHMPLSASLRRPLLINYGAFLRFFCSNSKHT